MRAERKLTYYEGTGMSVPLARRYYRLLGEARRILDVGCGAGAFGRNRPADDYEVVGLDVDAGAVELAAESGTAFIHDVGQEPLPFQDDSFDAVLAKDVLEHLPQPVVALREFERVLRPGGLLLVSVVMSRPKRVWADYTHVRGFTQRSARQMLADAGFVVRHVWRMGGVPLSTRLNFVDAVPLLLGFPLFDHWWGSSWELLAAKPPQETDA
jgi:SAM-dependent methyltransferase